MLAIAIFSLSLSNSVRGGNYLAKSPEKGHVKKLKATNFSKYIIVSLIHFAVDIEIDYPT